jgi:hypothetical protein
MMNRDFSETPSNIFEEEWDEYEWSDMNRKTESRQHNKEEVRRVKQALNRAMGLRLKVDGVMGPQTRSAIRSFQRSKRLPVDGNVGPDTKRALIAAARISTRGFRKPGELESEFESSAGECGGPPPTYMLLEGLFTSRNRWGHRWYVPVYSDNPSKLAWLVTRRYLSTKGITSRDPKPGEVQSVKNVIMNHKCNNHLKGRWFLPRLKEDRYTLGGRHFGAIYIPIEF